jgi:hypothetical protein
MGAALTVDAAVSLLLALINNAAQISALIEQAKSSGSNTIDPTAWAKIIAADDAARQALADAIAGTPPKV